MATFTKYQSYVQFLSAGSSIAFGTTNTWKAAIAATAYTPAVATDDELADVTQITGTGYTAGGEDIQNDATRSGGTVTGTAVDVTWTATAADWGAGQEVVIHDDTSVTDKLVNYYDYGTTFTVGNGETFTLDFGASYWTLA